MEEVRKAYDVWSEQYDTNDNKTRDRTQNNIDSNPNF